GFRINLDYCTLKAASPDVTIGVNRPIPAPGGIFRPVSGHRYGRDFICLGIYSNKLMPPVIRHPDDVVLVHIRPMGSRLDTWLGGDAVFFDNTCLWIQP